MKGLRTLHGFANRARRIASCPRYFSTTSPFLSIHDPSEPRSSDYLQKYQQKLREKAQKEGLGDVQDLLKKHEKQQAQAMEEKIKKWKEHEAMALEKAAAEEKEGKTGVRATNTQDRSGLQGLNKIMKVDMIKGESPEHISDIWNNYHLSKTGFISGVMSDQFYTTLTQRASHFPFFVLPLPREDGYEFFFMQIVRNSVYFTPLLEYKTKQEHARPHLVLNHFDEFAKSKGIVLMNGEIFSKVLKPDDAKLLVYLMQMFYVTGGEKKKQLVEDFHRKPAGFNFQWILDEADKMD
ncbi:hypothetical protein HDU67_004789 [Dinochytrium kinnereticum]|nr:hypothetical protein HDU67_004789 [Dinochytrium kinnereticum]